MSSDRKIGLPNAVASALDEAKRVVEATQRRALGVLHDKRILDRDALWVWLSGSKDACWRVTHIVERDDDFMVTIALPGVDDSFLALTQKPRELKIQTRDTVNRAVPRLRDKLRLPVDLQSEQVTAHLVEGSLVIVAPKAGSA